MFYINSQEKPLFPPYKTLILPNGEAESTAQSKLKGQHSVANNTDTACTGQEDEAEA